mgnify:CR=1 FL=1
MRVARTATLLLAMVLYGVSRALSSGALDAWFIDALQAADPNVDLQPCRRKMNVAASTPMRIVATPASSSSRASIWT